MSESYWNPDSDPYLYPGSLVLRNIPDIHEQEALDQFEQRAAALRLDEVIEAMVGKPLNLALWQNIHRILFQDVYEWSGETRSVHLAKGKTVFAMPEHIKTQAGNLFDELDQDDIASLDSKSLIKRLSSYFGELNVLHPFREGNGRTQKLMFDEIARRASIAIHWERMEPDILLDAVINAYEKQDYAPLEALFERSVEITS
jgi:cell filamentation protein